MYQDPKVILLVDHELHILHVLALKLRKANYHVVTCQDGLAALELAEAERPDLVIADYRLPSLSGVELCQRLRQISPVDTPLTVILAPRGHWIDVGVLAAAGVNRCVDKPFSPRQLLGIVDDLVRNTVVCRSA